MVRSAQETKYLMIGVHYQVLECAVPHVQTSHSPAVLMPAPRTPGR